MSHQRDELLLQRLVDGELDEPQQQEFLAQLDHEPSGWRRLAVAFVETQIWARAYREAIGVADPLPAVAPPSTRPKLRPLAILSAAAALLVAWALGAWQGAWWGASAAKAPQVADQRKLPADQEESPPARSHEERLPAGPRQPPEKLRLYLGDASSDAPRTVDVPLIPFSQLSKGGYPSPNAAIPEPVRETLTRYGYRVHRHTELLQLRFEDGRRVILPVDYVRLAHDSLTWYP